MKDLVFTVTPDEANLIGHALGQLPYVQVFQLIAKIQVQAAEQEKPQVNATKEATTDGKTDPS